jgi:hypothetical protein
MSDKTIIIFGVIKPQIKLNAQSKALPAASG